MLAISSIVFDPMKKKLPLILINAIVFISLFIIFDMLLSNFYIKSHKKICFDIEENFYKLKKNCETIQQFYYTLPSVKVLTNKFGHRTNKNIKNTKKKIFFFGDSFTYGVGVNYDDSFVGIVDNKVKDYEMFNFAVPSYSPSLYLYQLNEMLNQEIIPDKIFIVLDLSDVHDESFRWMGSSNYKPILKSGKYKKEQTGLKKFINKNFQVSRIFAAFVNRTNRNLKYKIITTVMKSKYIIDSTIQTNFTYVKPENLNNKWLKPGKFKEGLNTIDDKLHQISDLVKNYNIDKYILIYPWPETLEYGQENFNWENFARDIAKKYDFILINMFPSLNKIKKNNRDWYNKLYFIKDAHFNKRGHKIIGNYIVDNIF